MFSRGKAKKKKTKAASSAARPGTPVRRWWRGLPAERRATLRTALGWTLALSVLVALTAAGLPALERWVLAGPQSKTVTTIHIRLPDRPDWLPKSTAKQIAAACFARGRWYEDRGLTAEVYGRASAIPWVRRVTSVRKLLSADGSEGFIDIRCEYRRPVACIVASDRFGVIDRNMAYVDSEGVRLPTPQVLRWRALGPAGPRRAARLVTYARREEIPADTPARKIHYVLIRGVRAAAASAGRRWAGDDLAAGLRLVGLLENKPYFDQITVVDVRNHAGRLSQHEPHLRMLAHDDRGRSTDIRFGRFPVPGGGDYVLSPQRKISYLDEYAAENDGKIAGLNRYLDLRLDQLYGSLN